MIKESKNKKNADEINPKKIMFVSHIDWNWIKQRPQFIAEELAKKGFNIEVCYHKTYNRKFKKQFQNNSLKQNMNFYVYSLLPNIVVRNNRILLRFNDFLRGFYIRKENIKFKAGILYLTYPDQVKCIPRDYSGIVIYDCMDNYSSFMASKKDQIRILRLESILIQRADHVFISSEYLKKELIGRNPKEDIHKFSILRNAYDGIIEDVSKNGSDAEQLTLSCHKDDIYKFAYVGTISSWFNFDYILRSLEDIPEIEYYLYGPTDIQVPKNSRIHYEGIIEHDKLFSAIKDKNCLIMPFKVNDIIEAVDPVKLYEYINFNKNILTIEYDEIERFREFVYFYKNYDSFVTQIRQLLKTRNVKYSNDQRISFLKLNTWEERAKVVDEYINNYFELFTN